MTIFHVPDMHCDGCVRAVRAAIAEADPRATVTIDLAAREVRVAGTAAPAALLAAINDAGFTPELQAA
jgi:copper chaperone